MLPVSPSPSLSCAPCCSPAKVVPYPVNPVSSSAEEDAGDGGDDVGGNVHVPPWGVNGEGSPRPLDTLTLVVYCMRGFPEVQVVVVVQ